MSLYTIQRPLFRMKQGARLTVSEAATFGIKSKPLFLLTLWIELPDVYVINKSNRMENLSKNILK